MTGMDVFNIVTRTVYPLAYLALLILSAVILSGRGGLFFAIGFGLELTSHLAYRALDVVLWVARSRGSYSYYGDLHLDRVYPVLQAFTFVLFLASMTFLVLGILKLSASMAGRK
jgi:hypothetical protein